MRRELGGVSHFSVVVVANEAKRSSQIELEATLYQSVNFVNNFVLFG
jgi:hypothetical protein